MTQIEFLKCLHISVLLLNYVGSGNATPWPNVNKHLSFSIRFIVRFRALGIFIILSVLLIKDR